MSTRGSVAWVDETGKWHGVYNHSDSYPTYLGREVFEKCKGMGISHVVNALKQYGDWREFQRGGICEYCGKHEGQPHSINATVFIDKRKGVSFPDPKAKNHSHGNSRKDQFDPRKDPLFMEWVYLLRPEENKIEVWHFVEDGERNKELPCTNMKGEANYTHVQLDTWDVNGSAPDYAEVQNVLAEGSRKQ